MGQPAGKVDMKNIAMVFTRQHHGDKGWSHVFVTALPIDAAALDSFDIAYIAPLYIYPYEIPPGSEGQQVLFTPDTLPPRMIRRRPNAEGAA